MKISFAPLLVIVLAWGLAGCGVEEEGRVGGDARYHENGLYTDMELGYAMRVPGDWKIEVATVSYAPWDLDASRKKGLIRVWNNFAAPGESLEAYVAHRTGEENSYADSEIVHAPVSRDGVPVIAVDQWMPYIEYGDMQEDFEKIGTKRRRLLYFERAGRIVTIELYDLEEAFAAEPAYARADSSLTFFQVPSP